MCSTACAYLAGGGTADNVVVVLTLSSSAAMLVRHRSPMYLKANCPALYDFNSKSDVNSLW